MLLAVSGNIGSGKTTLVKRLSETFGYQAEFEATQENPYLAKFYEDMHRWAFPLQVYFLGHRFRQGIALNKLGAGAVLDRTIYEDANVFAKNLYRSAYLSKVDYENYLSLYQSMIEFVPKPDLLIYLQGSSEKLKIRINQRSDSGERSYENEIPLSYLEDLNCCYEEWIEVYEYSPVITIDIETIDLIDDKHFINLVQHIKSKKRCDT